MGSEGWRGVQEIASGDDGSISLSGERESELV